MWSFTFTLTTNLISNDPDITATATDPKGNTSAFSAAVLDPPAVVKIPAPVLSAATYSGGTLTVTGSLKAQANTTYTLQFFAEPTNGAENMILLGSLTVNTNSKGVVSFTFTQKKTLPAGDKIEATAADIFGNTSKLSAAVTVRK